jgi:hypothetical protein
MNRGFFAHETRRNWTQWILKEADRRKSSDSRVPESWTERVVDSSKLIYDTGTDYFITEDILPKIRDLDPPLFRRVKSRLARALPSMIRK